MASYQILDVPCLRLLVSPPLLRYLDVPLAQGLCVYVQGQGCFVACQQCYRAGIGTVGLCHEPESPANASVVFKHGSAVFHQPQQVRRSGLVVDHISCGDHDGSVFAFPAVTNRDASTCGQRWRPSPSVRMFTRSVQTFKFKNGCGGDLTLDLRHISSDGTLNPLHVFRLPQGPPLFPRVGCNVNSLDVSIAGFLNLVLVGYVNDKLPVTLLIEVAAHARANFGVCDLLPERPSLGLVLEAVSEYDIPILLARHCVMRSQLLVNSACTLFTWLQ